MKVCEAHGNKYLKYLKEARISCEFRILDGWGFLFIGAQTEYMMTCNRWFKVLGFGYSQILVLKDFYFLWGNKK